MDEKCWVDRKFGRYRVRIGRGFPWVRVTYEGPNSPDSPWVP